MLHVALNTAVTVWLFYILHVSSRAIALVLPAIGMIEAGFTSGERPIGLLGLALMLGLGIGYYLVLRLIFKSSPE